MSMNQNDNMNNNRIFQDARHFTTYVPRRDAYMHWFRASGSLNQEMFRSFVMKNAEELIRDNHNYIISQTEKTRLF